MPGRSTVGTPAVKSPLLIKNSPKDVYISPAAPPAPPKPAAKPIGFGAMAPAKPAAKIGFADPRSKDPKYIEVAKELGIDNIKNNDLLYKVQTELDKRKDDEFKTRLDTQEKAAATTRAEDLARQETQFAESNRVQQEQFNRSLEAQARALQIQIEAQKEAQRRAEELNLRSQVPQLTVNSQNARRIRSKESAKQTSRRAAMGVSQLRVPLSIGSMTAAGSSPVKLNIGM